MKINRLLLSVFFLSVISIAAHADLEADLRKVYQSNMEGLQVKQLDRAMSFIHSKSPVFDNTKLLVEQLFKYYDLKYELMSFKLIGGDDELKVARVAQKTTKIKGKAFNDNITDTIQVFRKDGNAWKIWHSVAIDTQYLNEAGKSPSQTQKPAPAAAPKKPGK